MLKNTLKRLIFYNWTVSICKKVDFLKKQFIINIVNLMIYVMLLESTGRIDLYRRSVY